MIRVAKTQGPPKRMRPIIDECARQVHDLVAPVSMYGPNRVERYGYLVPPVGIAIGEACAFAHELTKPVPRYVRSGADAFVPESFQADRLAEQIAPRVTTDLQEFARRVKVANEIIEMAHNLCAYFKHKK